MKNREPKFMRELHKIRAEITRQWKNRSTKEISSSLHQAVKDFKASFTVMRPKSNRCA